MKGPSDFMSRRMRKVSTGMERAGAVTEESVRVHGVDMGSVHWNPEVGARSRGCEV